MASVSSTKRGRGQQKHNWTTTEDTILVESLLELHSDPTWRADTSFKSGYLGKIEVMMEAKLPRCGLKVSPHIESRIKTLKAKYFALTELPALSGFEWNKEKMMLACEKSAYDETTKGKKDASGLYDKPFPHYHSLGEIMQKIVLWVQMLVTLMTMKKKLDLKIPMSINLKVRMKVEMTLILLSQYQIPNNKGMQKVTHQTLVARGQE